MFSKHVLVVLLPFYIAAVNAANDWSKPCTSGVCEWDTKEKDTYGNMIVSAATSALSDITPAAGWHILDCDPNSLDPQTIRLVCESGDAKDAGCDAIYEDGVENTVVRLPNSCAQGPFARLVRIWDSKDQKIPDEARQKFRKRTTAAPGTVKNAIIDFNFAAVPPKNNVDLLVTASNNPVAPVHEQAARIRRAHSSQKMRRGVTGRAPTDAIATFLNKLGELTKGGVSTVGSSPVTFKKNFSIAKNSKTCPATSTTPALTGTFDMNVDIDINARVSYGFAVAGKIVPPTIGNVGFSTEISGNASAIFHIAATAEATFETERLKVTSIPLSSLSFPGVATVGPTLELDTSGKATLGLTGQMDVGTSFDLPKIELRLPPKNGPSESEAVPVKAPLKLEVSPQATLGGSFEGHLIPRLALGVNLLNGLSRANVFVDLDMSGTVKMGVKAATTVTAGTAVKPTAVQPTTVKPPAVKPTAVKPIALTGCVEAISEIAVSAGVDGAIPGLFDKTVAIPILKKPFELFKKCFGEPAPASAKKPAFLNPGKAPPVVGTSDSTASGSPGTKSGLNDAAKLRDKLGVTTGAKTETTAKAPAKPGKTRSLKSIDKRASLPSLTCPGIDSTPTTLVSQ